MLVSKASVVRSNLRVTSLEKALQQRHTSRVALFVLMVMTQAASPSSVCMRNGLEAMFLQWSDHSWCGNAIVRSEQRFCVTWAQRRAGLSSVQSLGFFVTGSGALQLVLLLVILVFSENREVTVPLQMIFILSSDRATRSGI